MADDKMLVAAYQGSSVSSNTGENLKNMRKQILIAHTAGACLIIFPELYVTGYNIGDEELMRLAEESDGPSFKQISQWAKELDIAVIYGYPEIDNSSGKTLYYNSAQFVSSDGTSLGNYRKQHLWLCIEGRVFTAGDKQTIITYHGMKIGLLICYDIEFPEIVRCLALEGVHFVAVPTAVSNPLISKVIPSAVIPSRARENQFFVAYVNHCGIVNGKEFIGCSCVCGPDGKDIVRAGEKECLMFASIDVSQSVSVRNENSYLKERRPELYSKLVA